MRIGKCPENAYKRSVKKYLDTYRETHNTVKDQMITVVRQTALDHEMAPAVFLQDGINAVCAQDAKAISTSIALALPPDTEEAYVSSVMKQLAKTAKSQNVPLTEAAVSTFGGLSKAVLQITVTAGRKKKQEPVAGKELLLVHPIALAGTGILAVEKKEQLLERFAQPFIRSAADQLEHLSLARAAELAFEHGAAYANALGEGGVFAGLWELAEALSTGLSVDLKAIPIRQETVEICECFRLNPYLLLSTGALLVVTENGKELCRILCAQGMEAALIGTLQAGNDRVLYNDGETRYLDLPQTDEIYRIMDRRDQT